MPAVPNSREFLSPPSQRLGVVPVVFQPSHDVRCVVFPCRYRQLLTVWRHHLLYLVTLPHMHVVVETNSVRMRHMTRCCFIRTVVASEGAVFRSARNVPLRLRSRHRALRATAHAIHRVASGRWRAETHRMLAGFQKRHIPTVGFAFRHRLSTHLASPRSRAIARALPQAAKGSNVGNCACPHSTYC